MTGKNSMGKFKVIEERGCDVEYYIHVGTYEECLEEIRVILQYQDAEDPKSKDPNYHNGNGDAYSYRIEDPDGSFVERHMALCYQ